MRLIILIFGFFSLSFNVEAKNLVFNVSQAQYKLDENKVLWEFYYSFPDTILKYVEKDDHYSGELLIDVSIENDFKKVAKSEWVFPYHVKEIPEKHSQTLYGTKAFVLEPGEYNVNLKISDRNEPESKANHTIELKVREFTKNELEISDIQMARLIEKDVNKSNNWSEMFHKNSFYVIPNPSHEYDMDPYDLYLYFEIYNAKLYANEGLKINYKILDGAQRKVYEIPKEKNSTYNAMAEIMKISLKYIPTGVYHLVVNVEYGKGENKTVIERKKKFYLHNANIKPQLRTEFKESATFEKSAFSTWNAEKIDKEFRKAKYIATKQEKNAFEQLSKLKAKQKFLYRFWKIRDPDTTTAVNEKFYSYQKAADFANRFFTYGNIEEGWSTERGRVLLKYGFPTERNQHIQTGHEHAYEEWFYQNLQGGVHFYFVDPMGIGDFQLVHSTAINEHYNPDWFNDFVPKFKNDYRKDNIRDNRQQNNRIGW